MPRVTVQNGRPWGRVNREVAETWLTSSGPFKSWQVISMSVLLFSSRRPEKPFNRVRETLPENSAFSARTF